MFRISRWVLTAVLLTGGVSLSATPAASAEPMNDDPMTGILPPCPEQLGSFGPSPVFTNALTAQGYGELGTMVQRGLLDNCANGNYQDPSNPSSFPVGAVATATPDTFSISAQPQTVVFNMHGVGAPDGFNVDYPTCMPLSTRSGGCSSPVDGNGDEWTVPEVAYRLANGAGVFVGPWKIAGLSGDPNPYFDLTRGSCPTNHADWTPGSYAALGFPCEWTLTFVTDVNGKPNLTTAMQVVVAAHGSSGSATDVVTHPTADVEAAISMVFTPGASTSLGLSTSATKVAYGKPLTLSATAVGPAPGTAVSFFSQVAGEAPVQVGQAVTGSDGMATLSTPVTRSATYWAQLGTGAVKSASVAVLVEPSLGLKVRAAKGVKGAKYDFTGTLLPALDGVQVVLQKQVGKRWKKAGTGRTRSGKVTITASVRKGATRYRLFVTGAASYSEAVSRTKTVRR
jgi:hypothetical protein